VELEELLMNNKDILEDVVFGVKEIKVGEEVCVYISVREGIKIYEEEIVK
jgi:acyl-coenzyme A synthetase/AMP-(fatty) acid ligase